MANGAAPGAGGGDATQELAHELLDAALVVTLADDADARAGGGERRSRVGAEVVHPPVVPRVGFRAGRVEHIDYGRGVVDSRKAGLIGLRQKASGVTRHAGDDIKAKIAEIVADCPEPYEAGRASVEVSEQAVQPFKGEDRSTVESVPHERVESSRFDVGVVGVDGILVGAVVSQEEPISLNPLHPPRQPETGFDAVVGGLAAPTDVVPLDPEPVSEKVVA